jgi:uncharacterized RDD family membrane protein YckC
MTDLELQQKRLLAAAIDAGILVLFSTVMSLVAGALKCSGATDYVSSYGAPLMVVAVSGACLFYVLGRDVFAGDRSIGKKLMGVRLVTLTGSPIGLLDSIKRNALFAPPFALGLVSAFIELLPLGTCIACLILPLQLLAGLAGLGALVWELVQITQEPDGVRVGDKMATTRVVL